MLKLEFLNNDSRPTTTPSDSGSAARAQARFARSGAMIKGSLAVPPLPLSLTGCFPFGDDVAKPNR
jgi:hypothetical protein